MKRSYDAIAGVYDILARTFIGSTLCSAQVYLVQYIPAGAKVLIVGGGTGWILEEIARVHDQGLQIDYLDISANMIARARARAIGQNKIRFIHQSAEVDFAGNDYDVILTPFFFDNFKEVTMRSIFHKLHRKLKQDGLWLYADFQVRGKHYSFQKNMLTVMYAFFRAVCNIEASQLPDVATQFATNGYKLIHNNTFKNEFIISLVHKKA